MTHLWLQSRDRLERPGTRPWALGGLPPPESLRMDARSIRREAILAIRSLRRSGPDSLEEAERIAKRAIYHLSEGGMRNEKRKKEISELLEARRQIEQNRAEIDLGQVSELAILELHSEIQALEQRYGLKPPVPCNQSGGC